LRKAVGEISGDSIELRIGRGEEFQTVGAETEKDRSPKDIVCQVNDIALLTVAGYLVHKEYLPVLELHFGDTGTIADEKVGIHKLGKLECTGDGKYWVYFVFFPPLCFFSSC
jgi:hypothetical protein